MPFAMDRYCVVVGYYLSRKQVVNCKIFILLPVDLDLSVKTVVKLWCLSYLAPCTIRIEGIRPTRVQLIIVVRLENAHVVATQLLRLAFCLAHRNLGWCCSPIGTFDHMQIEGHAIQCISASSENNKLETIY